MPGFLFHLPFALAALLIIGSLACYSMIGLSVTRRLILPRMEVRPDDSEFTGAMVQAVMVFYGLAVALVAVSVWQTHADISGMVSEEASRIGGLYRDVSGYPEPTRSELRGELLGYTNYLIDEAWPLQNEGRKATRGVEWMNRLQASLAAFEPSTEGRKILHAEALAAFNRLIEARRVRLDAMDTRLPSELWFIINFGACVSLAATFFFKVRDVRLHAIQVLLLAVFVGLVISMILAFDRPFLGDLGIGSEPYQVVRDQLMDP
ncbi:MAG: DUF4239 domain-containing protein [Akkermansiaceae bacterium]|jgi:hypothetical protein|nr:DUF4239 domain-containing protein [Akkermansiaceae bacterium]MCU0779249.1 DUF4239 domain-containing protein [Akkermansiaceae bacterium]